MAPLASFGLSPSSLANAIVFVFNPFGVAILGSYTFKFSVSLTGISAGSAVVCVTNVNVTVSLPVPDAVPAPQVCASLAPETPPAAESFAMLSAAVPSPQFIV